MVVLPLPERPVIAGEAAGLEQRPEAVEHRAAPPAAPVGLVHAAQLGHEPLAGGSGGELGELVDGLGHRSPTAPSRMPPSGLEPRVAVDPGPPQELHRHVQPPPRPTTASPRRRAPARRDPPVAQPQGPVGDRRRRRVVARPGRRSRPPRGPGRRSARTRCRRSSRRAPRPARRPAAAPGDGPGRRRPRRAGCSPPESSAGRASSKPCRPTRSSSAVARRSRSAGRRAAPAAGRPLARHVRSGGSARSYCWSIRPSERARNAAAARGVSLPTSAPSTRATPADGARAPRAAAAACSCPSRSARAAPAPRLRTRA